MEPTALVSGKEIDDLRGRFDVRAGRAEIRVPHLDCDIAEGGGARVTTGRSVSMNHDDER